MRFVKKIVVLVALYLSACSPSKKINSRSFEIDYDYHQINPQFAVWHFSNDSTRVYVKNEADNDFMIEYKYFNDVAGKVQIDSSVFIGKRQEDKIQITSSNNKAIHQLKRNIFFFHLASSMGKKNLLEIKITDLKSGKNRTSFIYIDKTSSFSRQNFIAMDVDEKIPLFNNQVSNERFSVRHYDVKYSGQKISVKYFPLLSEPAPPSFFDQKIKPFDFNSDSAFSVSQDDTIQISREGIYHFQMGDGKDGFTLFHFQEDYPQVTTPDKLAESLRYLNKNEEYERMKNSKDKKLFIDTFWLQRGGDKERAKILIKEYYNRIQYANQNFTSYKDGWQTDRGLIYVIYGKPDMVYRYPNSEHWTYNKTSTEAAVTFYFVKVGNTFSDNHFYLMRNIAYEDSWNIATHKWRHGRINEITK